MELKLENKSQTKKIRLRVPASSANLGPGFDTLGLALNCYIEAEVETSPGGSHLEVLGEGREQLIEHPENNLFVKSLQIPYQLLGEPLPELNIRLESKIPFASGLGSSAAATIAGLCMANALLGGHLSNTQILAMAIQIEGHADNVAAALVGGLVCVMIYQGQVYYQKIPVPVDLQVVLAVPDYQLPTQKARAVIPEQVAIKDTVFNLQRCCFLLASFYNQDFSNLDKAMDDMIYQPLRKHLIPGFDQVLMGARDAGALGVALSGAGPTMLAFCRHGSEKVGKAMQEAFAVNGIKSTILQVQPDFNGAFFY